MKQKSLIKNVIYNFLYTGLNFLFPLITSPYVSRTLGVENIGKVNFSTSIVNWFILFASFGVTSYGVREISKNRDNSKNMSKVFSELIVINGLLSAITTIIYVFSVLSVPTLQSEGTLHLVMTISIALNMLSIDWLYQGIEEYSYITIRSFIIKLISLIAIFMLINSENDYVLYGLISVLATGFGGILNFIYSRRYVKFTLKDLNLKRHLSNLKVFFVHSLVVSLYTNLDQPLLGFLIGPAPVAYMNRSKVVTNMAISASTAISNATYARASYYINEDRNKFNTLLSVVPNYITWITVPMVIGIIILAPSIMYILGGEEFLPASLVLQLISPTIMLAPMSAYLQNQVLLPTGNERVGLKIAVISSIVSLVLNSILIPTIGVIGSAIANLIAEVLAVVIRYVVIVKFIKIDLNLFNINTFKILVSSLTMLLFILNINNIIGNIYYNSLVVIASGFIVYILFLFILKEKTTLDILKLLRSKI